MDSDMFWKSPSSCRLSKVVWVFKQLLLFVGIINTALLMLKPLPKISYTFNLIFCSIPSFWVWLKSWFSPPYVYIIINFILILVIILASSSSSSSSSTFSFLHYHQYHHDSKDINISVDTIVFQDKGLQSHFVDKYIVGSSPEVWSEPDSCEECPPETSTIMPDSGRKCTAGEATDILEEPVIKAIVCRWEDDEQYSLDAKWKVIMEDQEKQLTKHLRKSQTWDVPLPHENIVDLVPREIRKLDTFVGERSSVRVIGGLRREELLSHDELNRQVEAFIKKCKNEMPFKIGKTRI